MTGLRSQLVSMLELDAHLEDWAIPNPLSTGPPARAEGGETEGMNDPHLVAAWYSYGPEARTATFHDGAAAALAEVEWLKGSFGDDTVEFRAFRLTEVRRGFVPSNEVLDMGGD